MPGTASSKLSRLPLAGLLVTLVLLAVAPATAQEARIDLSSGLLGVTANETAIVRVVQTNRFAERDRVVVVLVDSRNRVVFRDAGVIEPGKPFVARVPGAQFFDQSLRVVISLTINDLTTSQPVATVEFFDPDRDLAFRGGPTCGPGAQPGVETYCPDWVADFLAQD